MPFQYFTVQDIVELCISEQVSEFFSPLDAGHSRGELHLEDV